jgi:hypothetical protein
MEADFSGWATKTGLKCSDGRTIMPKAFEHMDGVTVPLVWHHGHSSPDNVLGHVLLENRPEGVYCYGFFNDTPQGINTQKIVQHKDINKLSIWANQLVERSKQVFHGMIKEVSLVLAGANPGALIDYVAIKHSDDPTDVTVLDDEAIIHTGLELESVRESEDNSDGELEHVDGETTVKEIYDNMDDVEKNVVNFLVAEAVKAATADGNTATHAEGADDANADTEATATVEGDLTHQEGTTVTNVFENQGKGPERDPKYILKHEDVVSIVKAAQFSEGKLSAAVKDYALAHGIDDIDLLFPDARLLTDRPEFDKRRTEWVSTVLNGVRKTPFSRIKSLVADLTLEQARARGYVKGNLKKEEFFGLVKRVTTPTTIYKKQKLDRDDIIDITDFDVVAWLKFEMRIMLDEEIARAILLGDGRESDDDDKVKDPAGASEGAGIRSIANDADLYAATVYVNIADASSSYNEVVDAIVAARRLYKGSGQPTLFTTEPVITAFMLLRDGDNRRMYRTLDELANDLRVAAIVPVEAMETDTTLLGIMVNLQDYTVGADKGGEVSMFDDFDIDYNQNKYLIEGRMSGALTKIRSALVIRTVASTAVLVVPVSPTFVDNVITPATTTGVTYKRADTNATVTTGAPITLTSGQSLTIYAVPSNTTNYYFANNVDDAWTFTFEA